MRTGRPKRNVPALVKENFNMDSLKSLYKQGLKDSQVAEILNVSTRTLSNWKNADKDFLSILKKGKEVADARVERSLFERATGYTHESEEIHVIKGKVVRVKILKHYPPEPVAQIFWLKNRKPDEWRDRQEHEHILKDFKHDVLKDKSIDELKKEAERIATDIISRRAKSSVN